MFLAAFTSALQAKPQAVHRNTAWLSRESGSTCPHAEHRWLVNAGLTFSTRPGALSCQPAHQQPPPRPQDPPVQPGLGTDVPAGIAPGAFRGPGHVRDLQVLDPDQVEPARDVRCWPSRPSPCAGRSRGPAAGRSRASPGRGGSTPRRRGPACAAAAAACVRSRAVRPGQCSSSPVDRAADDRHAPVDAHHLAVTGRGNRLGDHGEGDMPAPRPVHRHPVGLHARRHRAGPAEPYPPGFGHPDLADLTGHAGARPTACRAPTIRNPSSRPALRHDGRPAGFPGSKNAAIAWAKSRRACCWTVWEPAPATGARPAPAVSCRHCSR